MSNGNETTVPNINDQSWDGDEFPGEKEKRESTEEFNLVGGNRPRWTAVTGDEIDEDVTAAGNRAMVPVDYGKLNADAKIRKALEEQEPLVPVATPEQTVRPLDSILDDFIFWEPEHGWYKPRRYNGQLFLAAATWDKKDRRILIWVRSAETGGKLHMLHTSISNPYGRRCLATEPAPFLEGGGGKKYLFCVDEHRGTAIRVARKTAGVEKVITQKAYDGNSWIKEEVKSDSEIKCKCGCARVAHRTFKGKQLGCRSHPECKAYNPDVPEVAGWDDNE